MDLEGTGTTPVRMPAVVSVALQHGISNREPVGPIGLPTIEGNIGKDAQSDSNTVLLYISIQEAVEAGDVGLQSGKGLGIALGIVNEFGCSANTPLVLPEAEGEERPQSPPPAGGLQCPFTGRDVRAEVRLHQDPIASSRVWISAKSITARSSGAVAADIMRCTPARP
jgi:hypothetical protein